MGRLELVVERHERVTDRVTLVDLVGAGGEALPFAAAGSHIEVEAGPGLVRPYSLCGDPEDRTRYRLAVQREPNSRGASAAICDRWTRGLAVRASEPRNLFGLDEDAASHVLVAGGIGITPILAMARRLSALGRRFPVHYCCRREADAAFLEDLRNLPGADVTLHLSGERRFDAGRDLPGPTPGGRIYVCGPDRLTDAVLAAAAQKGWRAGDVRFERFDADVDLTGGGFEVRLASGGTFLVPEGASIAEVLTAAGYEIEMSCEKGICGSCITAVLEGAPEHRDHYLTDEEKAEGRLMALCCSRAKTPSLTLDL